MPAEQLPEIGVQGQAEREAVPAPQSLSQFLDDEDRAVLVVNGKLYENWTAVTVSDVFKQTPRVFALTLAEPNVKPDQPWGSVQIKPGDRATLYLAGLKVCDGYIVKRSPAYDRETHQVTVEGASRDFDLSRTSARPREYKGYTLQSLARGIIKDSGVPVDFILKNPPKGASDVIRRFTPHYGETVAQAIQRLAASRGVFIRSNADGNLEGSGIDNSKGPVATLKLGVNILAGAGTLSDENLSAKVFAVGQDGGSDQRYGRQVAEGAAVAEGGASRPWRQLRVLAEQPGVGQDLQRRADFQAAHELYTSVQVNYTVMGWRRPDGQLWQVTDSIQVEDPFMFPTNGGRMTLGLRAVTFNQSNAGTTTVLELCLQTALGSPPDPNVKGPVPNLLGTSASAARVLSPDDTMAA